MDDRIWDDGDYYLSQVTKESAHPKVHWYAIKELHFFINMILLTGLTVALAGTTNMLVTLSFNQILFTILMRGMMA